MKFLHMCLSNSRWREYRIKLRASHRGAKQQWKTEKSISCFFFNAKDCKVVIIINDMEALLCDKVCIHCDEIQRKR